jgi:alpha-N-arabinofuranosidase
MASYAPLFAHVDGWQWTPDEIWFDNLRSYGTPNYYVQELYSLYKGTDVVPLKLNNQAVSGQNGVYASAVTDSKTHELIIKFINSGKVSQSAGFVVKGKKLKSTAIVITLHSDDLVAVNSLDKPTSISPVQSTIQLSGNKISLTVKPYSMNVIRVKLSN